MRITSTANPIVKRIRKLASRKHRRRERRAFAEGIRLALSALERGAEVELVLLAPELLAPEHEARTREVAAARSVPVQEVSAEVFARLSARDDPSGLGALVATTTLPLDAADPHAGLGWAVLDGVQFPGNLGTILRTADAVGAAGLILLEGSTDPYDPVALRASKGAVFARPVVATSTEDLLAWAAVSGVTLAAVTPDAALDAREAAYPEPLALVFGSEQHGVRPALLDACALRVRLPMAGAADSLNLAVAAGVLLYEVERQQRFGGG